MRYRATAIAVALILLTAASCGATDSDTIQQTETAIESTVVARVAATATARPTPTPTPTTRSRTLEIPAGETLSISVDREPNVRKCRFSFQVRQEGSVDILFSPTDQSSTVAHGRVRTTGETREFTVDPSGNYLIFDNEYSRFASKTIDLEITCGR